MSDLTIDPELQDALDVAEDALLTAQQRIHRDIRQHADRLDDALHALRNGSPHITDEFLDRTVRQLSALAAAYEAARDGRDAAFRAVIAAEKKAAGW